MQTITPGHEFETSDGQRIRFRLGALPGITTEEMLDVLIARLEHFQQQNADYFTFQAVRDCVRIKAHLSNRAVMRADRGLTGTNLPTVDFEAARAFAAQGVAKPAE